MADKTSEKADEEFHKQQAKDAAAEERKVAKEDAESPEAKARKRDEEFRVRQAAEAARADEGNSRPMLDERLLEPKSDKG